MDIKCGVLDTFVYEQRRNAHCLKPVEWDSRRLPRTGPAALELSSAERVALVRASPDDGSRTPSLWNKSPAHGSHSARTPDIQAPREASETLPKSGDGKLRIIATNTALESALLLRQRSLADTTQKARVAAQ